MLENHATSIGRLRVRSDMRDSLLTRIRLERLLSGVDWRPTALPVNAILCIRKAVDPLPKSFSLSASSLQPGYEWQQALTSMLNRFASQAVRPLTKLVPPDSDAVVFLDDAELLACLAVDWRHGSLTTNWWWRGILGDRDLAAVMKLWIGKSQYVPAALQHLATINQAVPFVAQLPDATGRQLAHAVASSFGATALLPLLDVAVARKALHEGVSATDLDVPLSDTITRDSAAEDPPWRALVPESDSSLLSNEQQRFLGVGLMIYRASSQARSRDFAQALASWQSSINVETQVSATRSDTPASQDAARPVGPREVSIEFSATPVAPQRSAEDRVSPQVLTREAKREQLEEQSTSELTAQQLVPRDAERPSSTNTITTPQPEPVSSSSDGSADALSQSEPVPATTVDLDLFERPLIEFDTQLGGLFYLINLGVYLNLYSDFTSPLAPGIELNIWDFVALVGSELLEGTHGDDPIWAALANLAGRDETQPPGANFEPENEWRLPPEWLLPFKEDQCKWETSRHRLRVLHPEGFLILDLPLAEDTHAQMQREISPYGISIDTLTRARLPRSALGPGPTVHRWLSLLMPYVRARLRVALGLKANDEILEILCRQRARVRGTDTHVDVYFCLADLPLAIRFAGLDRDPGWVPAAGRFISFHFD